MTAQWNLQAVHSVSHFETSSFALFNFLGPPTLIAALLSFLERKTVCMGRSFDS